MQTKRLISMLLVVVLTLVCGATTVAAQDEANDLFVVVEVESSATMTEGVCTLKPGDTVDVRVIIAQKTDISLGFQFVLGFDENVLEPTTVADTNGKLEYTSGNLFGSAENVYVDSDEAGIIRYLAFVGLNAVVTVADDSVVMTTTFKVKEACHGNTGLTLSNVLTFSGYDQIDAVVTDANTAGYNGATICVHEFGEAVTTEATCTTPATSTYVCTTDGCESDPLVFELAPALGHTFGEWKVVTEATDTTDGVQERSCACGETESAAIPSLGQGTESETDAETELDTESNVDLDTETEVDESIISDDSTSNIDSDTTNTSDDSESLSDSTASKGCKSVVGTMGALAVVMTLSAGVVVCKKRK